MKKIVIIAFIIIAIAVTGILFIRSYDSENAKAVTVGLVLNGSSNDCSWSQSHYEAMLNTSEQTGVNLIYRENVAEKLGFMGVSIDKDKNNTRGEEIDFSTPDSKVKMFVIPTNEELMIAQDTFELVSG